MKKLSISVACALTVLTFVSCDRNENEDIDLNGSDQRFFAMASMSNFAEIDLGNLASDSAENEEIKAFGDTMVLDHSDANTELKTLAANFGLPAPDALDSAHTALKNQLMMLDGRRFDSLYIHSQVEDHLRTIDLFQTTHMTGRNRLVKNYVDQTLPQLFMHLQRAQELAEAY